MGDQTRDYEEMLERLSIDPIKINIQPPSPPPPPPPPASPPSGGSNV